MSSTTQTELSRTSLLHTPRRRLATSLLLAFMALALVPVVVMTSVSAVVQANLARENAFERMAGVAASKSQQVDNWVSTSRAALLLNITDSVSYEEAVGILTESEAAGDEDMHEPFMEHAELFLEPSGPFNRIMLVDTSGTVAFSSDPAATGWNVSDYAFFQDGRFQDVVETPLEDPVDGLWSIYYAAPINGEDGALLGVLAGRTSTEALTTLATERTGLGQTGEIQLVAPSGAFLTPLRFGGEDVAATSVGASRGLEGVDGQATYRDYRGQQVIGVYRWLSQPGMALVVKQDTEEALAASRSLILTNVLTAAGAALAALALGFIFVRRITRPIAELTDTAVRIAGGDRSLRVATERKDELGSLASAFNEMTRRVDMLVASLEARVAERTRDLETTAEISRAISAVRDLDTLLQQVTELIRERYSYYHAQVFLVDDVGEFAVLRASTGEVGKLLLERKHKLAVNSQSVIGQVTGNAEYVVARDTDSSTVHRRNEFLPDTRSELALPLMVGGEVIGALDVQSVESDAFDAATIEVLQAVADQVAIAINNARLFEESRTLLKEQVELSQLLTREGWDEFLARESETKGYTYDLTQVRPSEANDVAGAPGLRAAIRLRGATIGELVSEMEEGQDWDDEDRLLVEAVAERVALALENARLFEQTQASLQEVGRLYEAGRAIVEASVLEDLLEAVVRSAVRDWVDRIGIVLVTNAEVGFERAGAEMRSEWKRGTSTSHGMSVTLTSKMMPMLAEMGSRARVVQDVDNDGALDAVSKSILHGFGDKSGIYLPLLASTGQVLGWLMVASTDRPYHLSDDEARYYQTVADQAGTAIDSHRLLEQTEQRARKLQATNAVSRAATSILDLNALLTQVVELLRDNFGFYHAQVFLVDVATQMAILRASTGEVGRELMARSHSLPVGSQSVIGRVTMEGVPIIAQDTDVDAIHRQNELLPDTRSEMAIPLKRGEQVIGALDVQSTSPHAFTEEDIAILQTLADQLAVALENAELFQDVQERVAELTTVNLISQEVSHAQTLDRLFETVSGQMNRAFEAPNGFLALYDHQAGRLHYPIWLEHNQPVEVESSPFTPGPVARVIETGGPVLLNEDVAQSVEAMGGDPAAVNAKSWLGVPLTIGSEVIGVLGIQDPERERAFDDGHLRMLSTLAAYLAVAVRNAQLFEETQQRAADLGFLYDVTAAALETTELDHALQRIAESLREELDGADATIVALLDESGQRLVGRAAAGYGREIIEEVGGGVPVGEGLAGWVVENREPALVGDVSLDPRYLPASSKTRSEVAVPLVVADRVVGVLDVESMQPDAFDESDLRLLQTLSSSLGAIIQSAQLLDEIQAANEQLRELDEMKTQFLANMSHELRTPLNSIIGFSRVILKGIDGPLTELQEQDLETIYASGQHLLGLINDVLDMSKIEAGKLGLGLEFIHLNEICEGVMSTAEALVKDKDVELVSDLPPDLPDVYGDPMRLRQVLLNLLSNAAKFTQEGSITVRAQTMPETPREPAHMLVSVIDTGIGIAEEDMDKLFEAFSQVDASTTRQAGGTGLGLSISRSLVELHGGRIWVESKVGVGSTFSFTIPLHPQPTQMEPIPDLALDSGDKPVVLAIDDDESVLNLYRRYVESEGMTLATLTSGHNVEDVVQEIEPVAIILDVMMPGRDGWAVITDLKLNPHTKHVPVILCTIVEEQDRAFRLGAADYLVKPILKDDMVSALRRLNVGGDGSGGSDGINGGAPADGQMDVEEEVPVEVEEARRSLLIIDDDERLIDLVREGLQENGGYAVRMALNGEAGLGAIEEEKPDLIILNLMMPDIDGFQVLARLDRNEEWRDIPVLVLTARDLMAEDYDRLTDQAVSMINKEAHDQSELLDTIAHAVASM